MPEDRVQMPSIRKDGTYDQSENFEIVGDKEAAKEALSRSLAQNAAAESGAARAEATAAEETAELSADEQARKDEIDGHVEAANAEAESLVESRWVDPAARAAEPETTTTRRSRRSSSSEE